MGSKTFVRRCLVPASAAEAFAWHERPGALERLTPPWEPVRVVARTGSIRDGDQTTFRLRVGPFPITWHALHESYQPGRAFRDRQVSGPFRRWEHTHTITPHPSGGATMEDRIDYELPLGALGDLALGRTTDRRLQRMFDHRHATLANDLERHRTYAATAPRIVAVSGASGMIGQALCAFLEAGGVEVRRLVRRAATGPREISWDPTSGTIDAAALEGVDAVVNLAGESIAGGRWTAERKVKIEASRVAATGLLSTTIAKLARRPSVLVSASAIGIYGPQDPDQPGSLTEHGPVADDFLARVCRTWEAAAQPARDAGVRVVHPRFGIVLSAAGGALAKMLPPFRMGVGGRIGAGTQWMSWVALDDVVYAIFHLLATPAIAGPVNVVAPAPVTNAELTRVLGRVLGRPAVVPVPTFAIRLALGELGQTLLLQGARVAPRVLEETGYRFAHETLEDALRHVLGRAAPGAPPLKLADARP